MKLGRMRLGREIVKRDAKNFSHEDILKENINAIKGIANHSINYDCGAYTDEQKLTRDELDALFAEFNFKPTWDMSSADDEIFFSIHEGCYEVINLAISSSGLIYFSDQKNVGSMVQEVEIEAAAKLIKKYMKLRNFE